MTPERIWAIMTPLATAAVLCALIFTMDRCATRNQEFRVTCVQRGGTLVESGQNSTCVSGQSVTRQ